MIQEWHDPDTLVASGYNDSERISCPTFNIHSPLDHFMIRCRNSEIISKGKLKLGDTALNDSYQVQGRLANASINISVAKSAPSSLPSN